MLFLLLPSAQHLDDMLVHRGTGHHFLRRPYRLVAALFSFIVCQPSSMAVLQQNLQFAL